MSTTPTSSTTSPAINPLLDLSINSETSTSAEAPKLNATEAAVNNVATTTLNQETPVPAKSLCSRFFTVIKEFFKKIFSIFTCAVKNDKPNNDKPDNDKLNNEDANQISAAGKANDLIQKAEAKFGSDENSEEILNYIKKVSKKREYTTDPEAFVIKWMEKQKTKALTLNFFKEIFNFEIVPVPSSRHEVIEERVNSSFMSSNEDIVNEVEVINEDVGVSVGSPPPQPLEEEGNEEGAPPPPPPQGGAPDLNNSATLTIKKSTVNSFTKQKPQVINFAEQAKDGKKTLKPTPKASNPPTQSTGLPTNTFERPKLRPTPTTMKK